VEVFSMAKRILVPLDRTTASAAILPLVADVARGAGPTLRLLHVAPVPDAVEREDGRVIAYADQEMARLESEGLEYLDGLAATLPDIAVECVVRFGQPVREILVEAEAWDADLIAVTATRTRWFDRIRRRRVADRIFRQGSVPVLVYRSGAVGSAAP
jgi:nucleotide-binding universal stress UspA family protein